MGQKMQNEMDNWRNMGSQYLKQRVNMMHGVLLGYESLGFRVAKWLVYQLLFLCHFPEGKIEQ